MTGIGMHSGCIRVFWDRGGYTSEPVKGIGPSFAAWEAAFLPLNYTRGRGRILRRPLLLSGMTVPVIETTVQPRRRRDVVAIFFGVAG